MMSTAGRVLIIGRIDSLKRRTSDSLLCLSARPSAATRLLLLLMLLLFGMCPTVVQSADNFDAVGDAMADPSPSHSHDSNSNNFDMHYDNFNQVTGNNETRILRRGKRYLEFPKGSRMSWRTNAKNNLLKINTLIAYGYGFRANYPFPEPKDQKKRNRIFFKRDLFSKLENALDGHGFDGRACLLKSFCTAIFDVDKPQQKSGMLFKLLKLIFRSCWIFSDRNQGGRTNILGVILMVQGLIATLVNLILFFLEIFDWLGCV